MRSIGVPKGVFVTLAVLTYCSKNGRAKCRATKCVGPNEHCCCSEIGPFKNSRLVFRQAFTRRLANLRIQTIACVNGSNQKRLVAKPILDNANGLGVAANVFSHGRTCVSSASLVVSQVVLRGGVVPPTHYFAAAGSPGRKSTNSRFPATYA